MIVFNRMPIVSVTRFLIISLRGGNQQKVLLARWLATRTRELAAERTAIILPSTEIEDLVQLYHRRMRI
jgi:ABC-type sugar transport system ATPase subunit